MGSSDTTVGPEIRFDPESLSKMLDDATVTPQRIVEMIRDTKRRRQLAQDLLAKVPELHEAYPDVEALNLKLESLAESLLAKQKFVERTSKKKETVKKSKEPVKEKTLMGRAGDFVKRHPILTSAAAALLLWWGWGHIHSMLAGLRGRAAAAALKRLQKLDMAPGAAHPGMGPGMEAPGGGMLPPGMSDDFEIIDPTAPEHLPVLPDTPIG